MDNRLTTFLAYKEHPWLHKPFKRLTRAEIEICQVFIQQNSALAKGEFEFKINRMFLDKPEKPKHYKEILELLTCANSSISGK